MNLAAKMKRCHVIYWKLQLIYLFCTPTSLLSTWQIKTFLKNEQINGIWAGDAVGQEGVLQLLRLSRDHWHIQNTN